MLFVLINGKCLKTLNFDFWSIGCMKRMFPLTFYNFVLIDARLFIISHLIWLSFKNTKNHNYVDSRHYFVCFGAAQRL